MDGRQNEQKWAARLDEYVDRPARDEWGVNDPPEAPVVAALEASAAGITPAPEFVERLSVRLRAREQAAPRRSAGRRLVWATGAVAVALALILALPLLLDGNGDLPPLPRPVHAEGRNTQSVSPALLAGARVTLTVDLPDAPQTMCVYSLRSDAAAIPATAQETLDWARVHGVPDPRLYRDPRSPDILVTLGSDGQMLGLWPEAGFLGYVYSVSDWSPSISTGAPLDFASAARRAAAFVAQRGRMLGFPAGPGRVESLDATVNAFRFRLDEPLGPITGYHLYNWADSEYDPSRLVGIMPELDGYALMNGALLGVIVTPEGEIGYAVTIGSPAALEPGRLYPIKSAAEAFAELTGEHQSEAPFGLEIAGLTQLPPEDDRSPVQGYWPLPPDWTTGESITVTGWLERLLVAEDGGDVLAQLRTRNNVFYELRGPAVSALAEAEGSSTGYFQVRGAVLARLGARRWELEVASWEMLPSVHIDVLHRDGELRVAGGEAWITVDGGERYRVPNLPDGPQDGDRVRIYVDSWPEAEQELSWWLMHVPPPEPGRYYPPPLSYSDLAERAFEVTRVTLAYYGADPDAGGIVQPVWIFEGQSTDGQVRFVAYVQAVVDRYVQETP